MPKIKDLPPATWFREDNRTYILTNQITQQVRGLDAMMCVNVVTGNLVTRLLEQEVELYEQT